MPYKLPFNKVISKWTQPMCNKSQGHIIYYMALLKMVFFMQNFNIYHACKIAKESKIRTDKDVELWFWNWYKTSDFCVDPITTLLYNNAADLYFKSFVCLTFFSLKIGWFCLHKQHTPSILLGIWHRKRCLHTGLK